MTVRACGAGRAIYLPWRCGALVERDGYPNPSEFLADVLEHDAGIAPLGGNLSPMVEVTLFERPGGDLLLHLVNASDFGVREVAPVPMRDAEVVLPLDGEPVSVTALVGGACTWTSTDEHLTIRVPELGLFEALAIGRPRDKSHGEVGPKRHRSHRDDRRARSPAHSSSTSSAASVPPTARTRSWGG